MAADFINEHLYNVPAGITPQQLSNFITTFHRWTANRFVHFDRRIKGLYNYALYEALNTWDRSKENELKNKNFQTLKDQETFWMQRSRIH